MNSTSAKKEIAIIGMSCRFPHADSIQKYWHNLKSSHSSISPIPGDRKINYDFSEVATKIGSFISNPYLFDNAYFKMTDEEAKYMDPQQRIMLELSVDVLENAGMTEFNTRNVGVFIGANQRSYVERIYDGFSINQIVETISKLESISSLPVNKRENLVEEIKNTFLREPIHPSTITGNITNMVAARVSHEFNLTGPSLTVDTACSSSLVAIHQACESLRSKECDLALSGGINLNLSPAMFLLMESAGVVSKSGRSIPFSEDSDGIILGEGGGLVLLKRMEDALSDNDKILAVIKGSGINNDGHTLGVMTPGWKGQLNLLKQIYSRFDYDKSKISMIEAHGTSTRIGDSVEITVLKQFFGEKHSLSIGSSKSNIGHLLGAAGIAGLIKAILCIKHKKMVPSLIGSSVNSRWKLNESKFRIQKNASPWISQNQRAVGVSAFGFGGTNSHIILEEYQQSSSVTAVTPTPTKFAKKQLCLEPISRMKENPDYFYKLDWIEQQGISSNNSISKDNWIVLCDRKTRVQFEHKKTFPSHTIYVHLGEQFLREDEQTFTIKAGNPHHVKWLFDSIKVEELALLYLPFKRENEGEIIDLLLLLKHLITRAKENQIIKLFICITETAYYTGPDDKVDPYMSAAATIFNAGINENKNIDGGLFDIESYKNLELTALLGQFPMRLDHPIILRNQKILRPILKKLDKKKTNSKDIQIRNKGSYLIIGGTSGIGLSIAKHLSANYEIKLFISGTRAKDKLPEWIHAKLDNDVKYFRSSVLDKAKIQQLIDQIIFQDGSLDGIIFAAGLRNLGSINSLTDQGFIDTLAVKIRVINILKQVTENLQLDFVYMMSSISSVNPEWSTGMGTYAAANSYLDNVAHLKQNSRTVWLSRSWTIWENTGMSKNISHTSPSSLTPIEIERAKSLFINSLSIPEAHLLILDNSDAQNFSFLYSSRKHISKIEGKRKKAQSTEAIVSGDKINFVQILKSLISKDTDIPIEEIDENESFTDLGLDSISALDISSKLENDYQLVLDPTLLYEYDSIKRLAGYLNQITNNEKESESEYSLLASQIPFFSNQHFYPGSPCNTQSSIHFERLLKVDILQQAFDLVVEQNEALRCVFKMTDNGPVQSIISRSSIPIHSYQFNSTTDYEKQIEILQDKYLNKAYDLENYPLLDVVYLCDSISSSLIFNFHHILTDGWSMINILQQLMKIYALLAENKTYTLASNTTLYSSYLKHVAENKHEKHDEAFSEYWTNELKGIQTLKLPEPPAGNGNEANKYKTLTCLLSSDQVRMLENIAVEKRSSLFLLILASYFKAVAKILAKEDVTIRLASEGRDRNFPEYDKLTCCLADSIPIRIRNLMKKDLTEVASDIRGKLSEAYRIGTSGSMNLARILKLHQNTGPSGISGLGLSYINMDNLLKSNGGNDFKVSNRVALPFTDLSMIAIKQNGELDINLNFFEKYVASSFCREVLKEVVYILKNSNREPIESVRNSKMNVLEMPASTLFPNHNTIHEKVFAACDQFSTNIAIKGNEIITYHDLKSRSLAITESLILNECYKTGTVAVFAYPGILGTTGLLASMASDCAYIPLDPDWPLARTKKIVHHSGVKTIITSRLHLKKLKKKNSLLKLFHFIVLIDGDENTIKSEVKPKYIVPKKIPGKGFKLQKGENIGDKTAYIMYTSGTTGIPKGVEVTHKALIVFLDWLEEEFQFNEQDRFIQSSSLGFGGSLRQMFSTMLKGGEMHPISRPDFKDIPTLLSFLHQNEITILNTVPSVLKNICDYLDEANSPEGSAYLEKLRLVLVGGEAFYSQLANRWFSHFNKNQRLFNLYGSTETIVNATLFEIQRNKNYPEILPVGKARKGSHVWCYD